MQQDEILLPHKAGCRAALPAGRAESRVPRGGKFSTCRMQQDEILLPHKAGCRAALPAGRVESRVPRGGKFSTCRMQQDEILLPQGGGRMPMFRRLIGRPDGGLSASDLRSPSRGGQDGRARRAFSARPAPPASVRRRGPTCSRCPRPRSPAGSNRRPRRRRRTRPPRSFRCGSASSTRCTSSA